MIKRLSIFLYGVISYAVFFATFLYAVGFIGNFAVPRTLDGAPAASFTAALLIDLGLLGLFAVQHSVMARPAFKRWFTRLVPESAERSTYVLLSSVALIALFAWWQPLGGVVWNVTDPTMRGVLWGGFAFGWLLVLVSDVPHQPLRPVRLAPGLAAAAWGVLTRTWPSARRGRIRSSATRYTLAGCSPSGRRPR